MKTLGICVMGVMMAGGAMASKPIQLSITPDIAMYNRHEKIEGVVLGIWSQNPQRALALGIISGSTGNSSGRINILSQNAWFTELPEALAPGMVFVNWRF